jgi:diguanylate cyclase (GGDEF)-like protein
MRIVTLFERAEDSDFSESYDSAADTRPDAITRVGRAYNRVRIQLASMVLTDPLTGCFNRRGFDVALTRELARSARANSELSMLAIDLDHFKRINDTYGHSAGDVILREFGALLGHAARAGDMVARTGGEEFSLLLPDTGPDGARRAAARLCEAIRAKEFTADGKPLQVTISVGVVSMSGPPGQHAAAELKGRADEALYIAKRNGRNQLYVWAEELEAIAV